jgi:phenylalanyl-tRNA synthetase alpha chain
MIKFDWQGFKDKIEYVADRVHLVTVLKPEIFRLLNAELSTLKDISLEEKRIIGREINLLKLEFEKLISEKISFFENQELEKKIQSEVVDITKPTRKIHSGSLNPLTIVAYDVVRILEKYGFSVMFGPEIEEDFYNFQALNVPEHHPARQMQDTFYLNGKNEMDENYLLRTQTTGVDVRAILNSNLKPPIAISSFGKVFRVESDKTHSPMFHQIEAVMIDKNINMSNLRYILESFLMEFFETKDIVLKFRPSFFPFTEPSAEVDVGYTIKDGKIVIGGSDKFLEILGCGMLHENVLKNMKIDPNEYQAIAFGCGLDRLAMLKYGIADVRQITHNYLDWIKHYTQ